MRLVLVGFMCLPTRVMDAVPEVGAGVFAAAPIEMPARDPTRPSGLAVGSLVTADTVGVRLLIELAMREVLLELTRALEPEADRFTAEGLDGL